MRETRRWFVLTGAGISAESGVPTFRGSGGLWEGTRPELLASPEGFRADPARVWRWYRWRRGIVAGAEPNAGHRALARLEDHAPSFVLATQNVDDLHERAGSRDVIHLHGRLFGTRCSRSCGMPVQEEIAADVPLCGCGAPLRPDVVWFGEGLPVEAFQDAVAAAEECDACLIVGTSAIVHPAAGLPSVASRAGALLVEVNPEPTALSGICDLALRGGAATELPRLLEMAGISSEPTGPGRV